MAAGADTVGRRAAGRFPRGSAAAVAVVVAVQEVTPSRPSNRGAGGRGVRRSGGSSRRGADLAAATAEAGPQLAERAGWPRGWVGFSEHVGAAVRAHLEVHGL